ncbi:ABC-type polar amino acid transport system, ATPase component [Phyllobacterium sp. YR531]|nr:ABC-type polar amino acid transport system, ATPase component [Phyllobacterium sp. YR531]
MIAIIGKSGSGKSTLLRCINGLELIEGGSISVAGAQLLPDELHLKALRLKVGLIFQQFNLFPYLSASGNGSLSQMVVKKTSKAETEIMARKMLDRVRLAHKYDVFPDELSGEQQQRVAIVRDDTGGDAVFARLYPEPGFRDLSLSLVWCYSNITQLVAGHV